MEGGRRAGRASDEDFQERAGRGTSFHADQHGQPGVDVQESRPMEGGEELGVQVMEGRGARRKWGADHPDTLNSMKTEQSHGKTGSRCRRCRSNEGVYTASTDSRG